jgi:predicted transposase YbfD/YdcC
MKDPRRTNKGNLKHPLEDILFLVIISVVSGCNDWETIEAFGETQLAWLRKYYPYKHGIPSHDTLNRVFAAMDSEDFGHRFISWAQQLFKLSEGELISIDGKTMRHSYDTYKGQRAFHLVSAYASTNRLCLGQVVTDAKSNEVTAIPELLELLFLKGSTVSIDAIGCQKAITNKIIEKKANYLIAVKGNQQHLYESVLHLFQITTPSSIDTQSNVGHGRIETRQCTVITNLNFLADAEQWTGIKSIIRVESQRYQKLSKKTSLEVRYYISSQIQDAKDFNKMIRAHWSIENNLHWMLDVVFAEDGSRRRDKNAAVNFNIISKVALALIERAELKKSKRQKRFMAGWSPEFRETILNL